MRCATSGKPGGAMISLDVARHLEEVGPLDQLPPRLRGIVARYVLDLSRVLSEAARVLRPGGHLVLVLVMGDTSLHGTPVRNSVIARSVAAAAGLKQQLVRTRDLLARRRYLPPPRPERSRHPAADRHRDHPHLLQAGQSIISNRHGVGSTATSRGRARLVKDATA